MFQNRNILIAGTLLQNEIRHLFPHHSDTNMKPEIPDRSVFEKNILPAASVLPSRCRTK